MGQAAAVRDWGTRGRKCMLPWTDCSRIVKHTLDIASRHWVASWPETLVATGSGVAGALNLSPTSVPNCCSPRLAPSQPPIIVLAPLKASVFHNSLFKQNSGLPEVAHTLEAKLELKEEES